MTKQCDFTVYIYIYINSKWDSCMFFIQFVSQFFKHRYGWNMLKYELPTWSWKIFWRKQNTTSDHTLHSLPMALPFSIPSRLRPCDRLQTYVRWVRGLTPHLQCANGWCFWLHQWIMFSELEYFKYPFWCVVQEKMNMQQLLTIFWMVQIHSATSQISRQTLWPTGIQIASW